jgi:hypothetical protein
MSNYETRGRKEGDMTSTGRKDSPSPKPLRFDQIAQGTKEYQSQSPQQTLLEVPSVSKKQPSSRTPSELSPLPSGTPSESSGPPSRSSELPSGSDSRVNASQRSEQQLVFPGITIEYPSRSPSELSSGIPSGQISRELSEMSGGSDSEQSTSPHYKGTEQSQGGDQQLKFPDLTTNSGGQSPSERSSGQISRELSEMSGGSDSEAVSQLPKSGQQFELPDPTGVPSEASTAEAAERQREAVERQRQAKLRGIFKGIMDTEKR